MYENFNTGGEDMWVIKKKKTHPIVDYLEENEKHVAFVLIHFVQLLLLSFHLEQMPWNMVSLLLVDHALDLTQQFQYHRIGQYISSYMHHKI
jgi:hypothetical protein